MARCEKQSVISPINVFLNCKAVRYLQKEEQGFFLVSSLCFQRSRFYHIGSRPSQIQKMRMIKQINWKNFGSPA